MADNHLQWKKRLGASRSEEDLLVTIAPAFEPSPLLLVDKRCRVFQSVAPGAESLCLLVADCPTMGLVTVKTLQPRLCHMQIMLPYPCFIAMAVLQAVLAGQLYLSMRLMAVKAFQ